MINKFSRYIIEKPKKTLTLVFIITLFWSFFIPNLKIDFSIEHLFSKNDPNVEKYFSFREEFGREDNVLTLIYKPTDILDKKLYQELESLIYDIEEINGVNNIISIFSISDIDDKAWLGKIDGNNTNWNRDSILIRLRYIQTDPSIGSRILSKNLEYGSIMLNLNDDVNNHQARSQILEKIKLLTLKTSSEWTYSGVSVLRTEYVRYMVRDNFLFLPPIAILLICILSFLFRNWVNVFLPILTVLITVIWLLGFMGLVGLDINIMTYIVPTLLFIIGIGDAIHIQAYFREKLLNKKLNPSDAMRETITQMFKVIFLTSITTSIGFLALTTTSIKILQEFGLEIACGVMIAWIISIIVVPSGIILLNRMEYPVNRSFSPLLNWLSITIPKKPWAFILIPVLISGISIFKIKDLSTDSSLMDDLRPENKLYQDLKLTEKHFGGVLPFEVLLKLELNNSHGIKKIINEKNLFYLEKIQTLLSNDLKESRFFSINDLITSIKRIRNEKDKSYGQEILDQIVQQQSQQELRLLNVDNTTLRISGLIENRTSSKMENLYDRLDSLASTLPEYLTIEYTGTTVVALKTNNYLVKSLVDSLSIAIGLIAIIMAFMFRSKAMLFASLVTNLIPIFTVLGILSWLGISIRPPTAMTFSVALGIAVDDSLHFLLRYRKELSNGLSKREAVQETIKNTGSALMITTSVLVGGFSILFLSAFLPTYQFGLLAASMIGCALTCDLTLLPALCLLLPKPTTN
jgi:predicted RND superfamily exporter protein